MHDHLFNFLISQVVVQIIQIESRELFRGVGVYSGVGVCFLFQLLLDLNLIAYASTPLMRKKTI